MTPSIRRHWTNCLALIGVCLCIAGCGGSDIPNPEADSVPVASTPPAIPSPPPAIAEPAPAPKPEPKAEVAKADVPPAAPAAPPANAEAPASPVAVAEAPKNVDQAQPVAPAPSAASQPADAAAPDPDAAAQASTPTDPAKKSEESAIASEMLALSAGTTTAAPTPPAAAPPGTTPAPGAQAMAPSPRGRDEFGGAGPSLNSPSGGPGFGGGRARGEDFDSFGSGSYRNGSPGRAPRDNKPVNFHNPRESVQAFLDALEDRDVERLSEATALRSPYEATAKHRELFQHIVDGSISEAQLSYLAETLEDYKISGEAPVSSTGRLGILVSKSTDNGRLQRKIIVRKEKAGWKVLDIVDFLEFKNFRRYTPKRQSSGRTN